MHVLSKIAGGTPLIPPFEGGLVIGAIVVTFTDMTGGCDGRSSGTNPCNDAIGSSAVAMASTSGSAGARLEG